MQQDSVQSLQTIDRVVVRGIVSPPPPPPHSSSSSYYYYYYYYIISVSLALSTVISVSS